MIGAAFRDECPQNIVQIGSEHVFLRIIIVRDIFVVYRVRQFLSNGSNRVVYLDRVVHSHDLCAD